MIHNYPLSALPGYQTTEVIEKSHKLMKNHSQSMKNVHQQEDFFLERELNVQSLSRKAHSC